MGKIYQRVLLVFIFCFFSHNYAAGVIPRESITSANLVHKVEATTQLIFNVPNNDVALAANRNPPQVKNEVGRLGASSNAPGIRYTVRFKSTNGTAKDPSKAPFLMKGDDKNRVIRYLVSYGGKKFLTSGEVLFEGTTGTKKPELLQIITIPYLNMLERGVYTDTLTFQLTVS